MHDACRSDNFYDDDVSDAEGRNIFFLSFFFSIFIIRKFYEKNRDHWMIFMSTINTLAGHYTASTDKEQRLGL